MKPPRSEHPQPYVSPEQIAAGVRVLRESGVLFAASPVDPLVVRRILETALSLSKCEQENSQTSQSSPENSFP
jgi:hypothetical protein